MSDRDPTDPLRGDEPTGTGATASALARDPTTEEDHPAGEGLQPGATLGRYVVLAQIGAGGMGIVYAAYDPELDRRIAVKILRPRHAPNAAARDRLLREAKAIARVSHPNVVHAYDAGVINGRVFIAMEYIDGPSLRSWCRQQPRNWREITAHYLAAGQGLAAARWCCAGWRREPPIASPT